MAKNAFVVQLILVILWCAAGWADADVEQVTDAEVWDKLYKEVFFDTIPKRGLEKGVILLGHIMYMHTKADKLAERSLVPQDMIDRAEYCYKALKDTNPAHCNVEHLDKVKRQLEQFRSPLSGNLELIYYLVHRNLVEVCGARHTKAAADLNNYLDAKVVNDLDYLYSAHYDYEVKDASTEQLRYWIFRRLKIRSVYTTEKIMKIWNKGPCNKLKTALQEMNLQSFRDYARLNAYMGPENAESSKPHSVAVWGWYINTCEQLDKLMPELAIRDRSRFLTILGTCFGHGPDDECESEKPTKSKEPAKKPKFQCLNFDDVCR